MRFENKFTEGAMLAQITVFRQTRKSAMNSETKENKCPMGKRPWLATFLAVAFLLIVLAKKLSLF